MPPSSGRFFLVPSFSPISLALVCVQSLALVARGPSFSITPFISKSIRFHMSPVKSHKETVSATDSPRWGLCPSQIGGMRSLQSRPARLQYATFVARGWHASLTCPGTSVCTTPSLIDGEERMIRIVEWRRAPAADGSFCRMHWCPEPGCDYGSMQRSNLRNHIRKQ